MEEVARELPGDFSFAWSGQALQEKESGSTSSSAFVFGLILVFLLLAAQFEKWTLPIAVVLTMPDRRARRAGADLARRASRTTCTSRSAS